MNDLEIFESLRPEVRPLRADDRALMRVDLFGRDASTTTERPTRAEDRPAAQLDLDQGTRMTGRRRRGVRGLLSIAAVLLVLLGVAGMWFAVGDRDVEDHAPAQQPSSTATDTAPSDSRPTNGAPIVQPMDDAPVWYDTIRPLLPEGFDLIVLTMAEPEVVGFKAFRTGTTQLLDITITLQPGYDLKGTGEAVTFSDEHGDYVESTSSVALMTLDQRRVTIRCGLSPVEGGGLSGSLAPGARDYCGDGFDNLDLDPASRRALAAKLSDEFPANAVTPAFGHPDTSPEAPAVIQLVYDFVGDRPFGMEQAGGVLRVADLGPNLGEPTTTELTVIHGIWPPDGDGSAFDDAYAPQGRFAQYGDIAVALVVVAGTGYHITTTDISQGHLVQLGGLLEQLIEISASSSQTTRADDDETSPGSSVAEAPKVSTSTIVAATDSELAEALRPDGNVLVVNASTTAGIAGSLSRALELCGYHILEPTNSTNGAVLDESIMYTHSDMPNSLFPTAVAAAIPIARWETLLGQPTPALNQGMLDSADLIIVVGNDVADAPWEDADTPLIDPGIGRLLIIDATTDDEGHRAVDAEAQRLRIAGVVAEVVAAAAPVDETMLMPIGEATPWTFAIGELAGVDGFDTWTPSLIARPVPDGFTAALVIGDN